MPTDSVRSRLLRVACALLTVAALHPVTLSAAVPDAPLTVSVGQVEISTYNPVTITGLEADTGFQSIDVAGILEGQTTARVNIRGTDAIRVSMQGQRALWRLPRSLNLRRHDP